MSRNVRGSLFVDYVRMLRAKKGAVWSDHLLADDMEYLVGRIEKTAWYPMATFERMGLAILSEIAGDDVRLVELFGRASVDGLLLQYPGLMVHGEPRETVMRFQALQRGFFDFPAFDIGEISDHRTQIRIDYQMSDRAEEAACHQSAGFFDRLLEISGANGRSVGLEKKRWRGDPTTLLSMSY